MPFAVKPGIRLKGKPTMIDNITTCMVYINKEKPWKQNFITHKKE
jgi:hypothetical protein